MDFFEKWFGVSPDGGSGFTEVTYVFLLALVIVLLFRRTIVRLFWELRDRSLL
jgi:hypothetical protein